MDTLSQNYNQMISSIIQPPRQSYQVENLGPPVKMIKGKSVWLKHFKIKNTSNCLLQCSIWQPEDTPNHEINVTSRDSFQINVKGQQLAPQPNPRPCLIYLHGNSGSRLEAIQLVSHILPEMQLAAFDFSGSGLSEGKYVTMGIDEQSDLDCFIQYLEQTVKPSYYILWGRSMGAVVAILYSAKKPNRLGGLILDSPFLTLQRIIGEIAQNRTKIPALLLNPLILILRKKIEKIVGKDIFCYSMENEISKLPVIPVAYVYSTKDTVCLPYHTTTLHKKTSNIKKLFVVEGVHNTTKTPQILEEIINFISQNIPSNLKLANIPVVTQFEKQQVNQHPNPTLAYRTGYSLHTMEDVKPPLYDQNPVYQSTLSPKTSIVLSKQSTQKPYDQSINIKSNYCDENTERLMKAYGSNTNYVDGVQSQKQFLDKMQYSKSGPVTITLNHIQNQNLGGKPQYNQIGQSQFSYNPIQTEVERVHLPWSGSSASETLRSPPQNSQAHYQEGSNFKPMIQYSNATQPFKPVPIYQQSGRSKPSQQDIERQKLNGNEALNPQKFIWQQNARKIPKGNESVYPKPSFRNEQSNNGEDQRVTKETALQPYIKVAHSPQINAYHGSDYLKPPIHEFKNMSQANLQQKAIQYQPIPDQSKMLENPSLNSNSGINFKPTSKDTMWKYLPNTQRSNMATDNGVRQSYNFQSNPDLGKNEIKLKSPISYSTVQEDPAYTISDFHNEYVSKNNDTGNRRPMNEKATYNSYMNDSYSILPPFNALQPSYTNMQTNILPQPISNEQGLRIQSDDQSYKDLLNRYGTPNNFMRAGYIY